MSEESVSTLDSLPEPAVDVQKVKPKKQKKQYPNVWPEETFEKAKEDYLTGDFSTLDLFNKYGISRYALVIRVKPKHDTGTGWRAEAIRIGRPPKQEPPYTDRAFPPEYFESMKADLCSGMTNVQVAVKYKVHVSRVVNLIAHRNWKWDIYRAREATRVKGFVESARESEAEARAEAGILIEGGSDDMATQVKEFEKAAFMQLKMLTGEMQLCNMKRQKMSSDKLEETLDKFGKLADALRKMRSAAAGDVSGSGGSGRLVRPGVMEQATFSPTDPAPTI